MRNALLLGENRLNARVTAIARRHLAVPNRPAPPLARRPNSYLTAGWYRGTLRRRVYSRSGIGSCCSVRIAPSRGTGGRARSPAPRALRGSRSLVTLDDVDTAMGGLHLLYLA